MSTYVLAISGFVWFTKYIIDLQPNVHIGTLRAVVVHLLCAVSQIQSLFSTTVATQLTNLQHKQPLLRATNHGGVLGAPLVILSNIHHIDTPTLLNSNAINFRDSAQSLSISSSVSRKSAVSLLMLAISETKKELLTSFFSCRWWLL